MPHANTNPPSGTDGPPADPATTTSSPSVAATKKRKRAEKPHILHSCTFKKPQWTYFHLSLTTPGTIAVTKASPPSSSSKPHSADPQNIDALTVLTLLRPPLQTYLGLMGSSISIDVLKTEGREVWVRVPRLDARGFRAAVSAWVGSCEGALIPGTGDSEGGRVGVSWRVVGEGQFVGSLAGGDGADLFG
ncbi:hypothetical protein BU24DRAFT_202988 [Aaosphaeria arxii CBS 175.79]|uniref:Ribonucleases P/MRP subunit Pop8-like domain-containing protein n=1 Tax=Aaosphaeria arxii CBS 175.79 TaxID=1450172 RepID=A0A6A5XV41_9PLEO|nr:uncharacterized protein BU24DRAFT_202988 [Aaosphaeria arxii CBS 175.79]KAF2016500.1 hypothetical protein BU24DRAFT_202988 [Aaosphaeria arxii CBS 175.79]